MHMIVFTKLRILFVCFGASEACMCNPGIVYSWDRTWKMHFTEIIDISVQLNTGNHATDSFIDNVQKSTGKGFFCRLCKWYRFEYVWARCWQIHHCRGQIGTKAGHIAHFFLLWLIVFSLVKTLSMSSERAIPDLPDEIIIGLHLRVLC